MKWIFRLLKPFIKFMSKLKLKTHDPAITGSHYYKWRDLLRPGDCILSMTNGEISNWINPGGCMSHGALYVGDIDDPYIKYVIEATGKGINRADLVTHLLRKDEVVVLRPNFKIDKGKLLKWAIMREGLGYDYEFEAGDDEYYCFEFVAEAYRAASSIQLSQGSSMGYKYYDSSSFLESDGLFNIIIDSRSMK